MHPTLPNLLRLAPATLALLAAAACSSSPPPHVARAEIKVDLLTLDRALTRYATTKGRFAPSIEELADEEWVEPATLVDPYGRHYAYVPSLNGSHDLFCYGPDGRPGGEGDDADIDLAAIRGWR